MTQPYDNPVVATIRHVREVLPTRQQEAISYNLVVYCLEDDYGFSESEAHDLILDAVTDGLVTLGSTPGAATGNPVPTLQTVEETTNA